LEAKIPARVRSCRICEEQEILGQAFSQYLGFPYQFSFHSLLHINNHLSSGDGIMHKTMAADQKKTHINKKKINGFGTKKLNI
jgi:hypothetical protein